MERVYSDDIWSLMCPHESPGLADVWGDEFKELYTRYAHLYVDSYLLFSTFLIKLHGNIIFHYFIDTKRKVAIGGKSRRQRCGSPFSDRK